MSSNDRRSPPEATRLEHSRDPSTHPRVARPAEALRTKGFGDRRRRLGLLLAMLHWTAAVVVAPAWADRQLGVAITYDSLGEVESLMLPTGESIAYTYAPGGGHESTLLDSAAGPVGIVQTSYDAGGGVVGSTYSDGAFTTSTFDDLGRLTGQTLDRGGSNLAYGSENHLYDERGYLASVERFGGVFGDPSGSPVVLDYGYDAQGQLESFGITQGGASSTSVYGYDSAGNPRSRTGLAWGSLRIDPLSGASFDAANRRIGWQYDASGRLVADERYTYGYNDAGRLAQVRDAATGDVVAHYLYDAGGHRVRAMEHDPSAAGSVRTIYYLRFGGAVLQEEHVDGAGELIERRTFALHNGQAVASAAETPTTPEQEMLFADRLGSTSVRWQGDGALAVQEYSPFGQQMSRQPSAEHVGSYGFTGHEDDPTGLTYMRARYYDPQAARFQRPDPAKYFDPAQPASLNLYQYASNSPVELIDPSGAVPVQKDPLGAAVLRKVGARIGRFFYNLLPDPIPESQRVTEAEHLFRMRAISSTFGSRLREGGGGAFVGMMVREEMEGWGHEGSLGYLASGLTERSVTEPLGSEGGPSESTGVALSDSQAFAAADEALANKMMYMARLTSEERKRVATMVGAANIETGQVVIGCSGDGFCAEDDAVEQLGGDSTVVRFSRAMRPRTWIHIEVCPFCQTQYAEEQFAPGTEYEEP
ncbi:MAG: hypothetical protein MI919_05255 [Holophagales bacterium]|nr:hypothetical protein [Holophagales bacterium]